MVKVTKAAQKAAAAPVMPVTAVLPAATPKPVTGVAEEAKKASKAASKTFTWQELAKHNKADDAFIAIRGKVETPRTHNVLRA